MTNRDLARRLRETASLIELTGGNAFRARAFERASDVIADLEEPAPQRYESGTLTDLDGIGDGMAGHVGEMLAGSGDSFPQRDELLGEVPTGLLEVLRVQGLGPKKARRLWQELGVTSLGELENAATAGRIQKLSGFGEKTQANLLSGARRLKTYRTRRRLSDATAQAAEMLAALRTAEGIERAEAAGGLRRHCETVEQIELIAAGAPRAAEDALAPWLGSESNERPIGDQLAFEGTFADGFPFAVRLVPPERFGTDWWLMTGSEAHCAAFREEHGVAEPHASEAALYEAAGLPLVPAELREGRGELEAASEGALPVLVEAGDLRGVLHNHSTYSDGSHSLREMAEAARARGLSYFGICDHSQSLKVASGLSPGAVREQQRDIEALNEEFSENGEAPFRVFSGIESDILRDGSLDYSDDVLASFDFVVGSVHQGLSMTEEEATERIVRAVRDPHLRILGHATGRQLLSREGYPLDVERVIEACAQHDVAVEFNANPRRLDLDWRHLRAATEAGVLVSINPDAHATGELDYMARFGVPVARKGWLAAADCLNAKPLEDFTAWIEQET
ncbi:MAG: DNA polymerase/3'-5' exonuclease PolX [Bacteroidetes bacterium QS_9_68_14]|nr:MAG: DNA polymerase/3'-5' exonuclease PolX [Bacteroidetes bacterium QS_9_68_14]